MRPTDWVEELAKQHRRKWKHLKAASKLSRQRREKINKLVVQKDRVDDKEVSLVVFGSIARDECTPKSDVDWALLVDGRAAPDHRRMANEVRRAIEKAKLESPRDGGPFGQLAFSHDLLHQIGGDEDTNRNTTRRMLLLLESRAIGSPSVRERVLRNVLQRYLDDERRYAAVAGGKRAVPRFLLNDIVRYWRTMAVDYANKRWIRADEKWAIRNIKLRMSRKLIFVAGLLLCFEPELFPEEGEPLERLLMLSDLTPLNLLAKCLSQLDLKPDALDAYDEFLGYLSDEDIRLHLEKLEFEDAEHNERFRTMREVCQRFQEGLSDVFFEPGSPVAELTKLYGVF